MSEGGTTLDETNLNSSDQLVGSATSNSGNGFDLSGEISGSYSPFAICEDTQSDCDGIILCNAYAILARHQIVTDPLFL